MKKIKRIPLLRVGLIAVFLFTLLGGTALADDPPAPFMTGTITIDGTETITNSSRLLRDGTPSTVDAPKSFPGMFGSGTYYFNSVALLPASVTEYTASITAYSPDAIGLFCTAYLDSFDITDMATNYLADAGFSAGPDSPAIFSFTVPAGHSLLLVYMNANGLPETNNFEFNLLTAPTFAITVDTAAGGTAQADVASAAPGDLVTLTATPDEHFRLKEWQAVSPADLVITDNTFVMPGMAVEILPVFEAIPPVLDSLLLTPPTKLTYEEGEALDLTGLVVTAVYDYGDNQVVTEYTLSVEEGTLLTPDITEITVSYTQGDVTKTATFNITVTPTPTPTPEPTPTPTEVPTEAPTEAPTPTGDVNAPWLLFGMAVLGFCIVPLLLKRSPRTQK